MNLREQIKDKVEQQLEDFCNQQELCHRCSLSDKIECGEAFYRDVIVNLTINLTSEQEKSEKMLERLTITQKQLCLDCSTLFETEKYCGTCATWEENNKYIEKYTGQPIEEVLKNE